MKKILALLLLFLLTCCSPNSGAAPTTDWSQYHLSTEAFDASENCLHLCWLGINPGVTTAEQAQLLLSASEQIDKKDFHVNQEGLSTRWYYESSRALQAHVHLSYSQGIVQSINLSSMVPFRISDFVNLLGEPDKLGLSQRTESGKDIIPYGLYYSSRKIIIDSEVSEKTGPALTDLVSDLSLNLAIDDKYLQPWFGFGHLPDYLSGQNPSPKP